MGISIILGTNGFIMEKMSFGDTVCSESLLSAGSSGVCVRQGLELVSIRVSFRIFFFFLYVLILHALNVSVWSCL